MKKYYIIRPDGTSIFALPYPEDFCYHCLMLLQEDGQRYKLLSSEELNISLSALKLQLPQKKSSAGCLAGRRNVLLLLADR